ncbi:MAG: hypothetical protein JW900_10780 [Anaerolineae bacterium]|nr:hypothetical protein [Anaerolineae bacterium]
MHILRDLSLILLAIEGAIATLAVLALFAAINYGLIRWRWWHAIPGYFSVAGEYLHLAQHYVERACQVAVAPILAAYRAQANLAGIARGINDKLDKPGSNLGGTR